MFEQLKEQVSKLEQEVKLKKELEAEDKEVLKQLSLDLNAHAAGESADQRDALIERLNASYGKFHEKHPELSVVLQSAMQILQNIGV